jgi:hypothetical protein
MAVSGADIPPTHPPAATLVSNTQNYITFEFDLHKHSINNMSGMDYNVNFPLNGSDQDHPDTRHTLKRALEIANPIILVMAMLCMACGITAGNLKGLARRPLPAIVGQYNINN